jgi:pyroglutamyl-peptidase
MANILITGFEPFGTAKYNPTKDIALAFENAQINGDQVYTDILPVSFLDASKRLFNEIKELDPYLVISMGVSASGINTRREDLNIETRGINLMNGKNPDANRFRPDNQKIESFGPEYRYVADTKFDPDEVVDYLVENGIRARVSDDAAKYVCNDLIYRTLSNLEEAKAPTKFSFVHMPWLEKYRGQDIGVDWDEKATMPEDEVVKGIERIIERA